MPGRAFGAGAARSSRSEDENRPRACFRQSSLSDQISLSDRRMDACDFPAIFLLLSARGLSF
jgi:hypothetical protein